MKTQYLDVMKEWQQIYDESPTEHLRKMLLLWQDIVNQSYQDGYSDGYDDGYNDAKKESASNDC